MLPRDARQSVEQARVLLSACPSHDCHELTAMAQGCGGDDDVFATAGPDERYAETCEVLEVCSMF